MEYPALVYRSESVYLLVKDDAEHAAALADGWFASVPEAIEAANPGIYGPTGAAERGGVDVFWTPKPEASAPVEDEKPEEALKRGPGRPKKA